MPTRTYEPVPARDVAFLGLGVMGDPMAAHLAAAGHRVTVYNRTAAKAAEWVARNGGKSAPTPAAAARGAELVFACVGNDEDLRSVTIAADGAFAGMSQLWISRAISRSRFMVTRSVSSRTSRTTRITPANNCAPLVSILPSPSPYSTRNPGKKRRTSASTNKTRRGGESFMIIAQKRPRPIRQKRFQCDSVQVRAAKPEPPVTYPVQEAAVEVTLERSLDRESDDEEG